MQFFAVDFIYTALLFVIVLSFIVFIHELGHFLPARYFGIKVSTFSIGFGKEIIGWTDTKGTRWKFSWIPLGGYVKFFGDVDAASSGADKSISAPDKQLCLHYRPVFQRIMVSFGGPIANYLLAMVLFFGVFLLSGQPGMSSKIESFSEDSPAVAAGLHIGDSIQSINGTPVTSLKDIISVMQTLISSTVSIVAERNNTVQTYIFEAKATDISGENAYSIGIKTAHSPPFQLKPSLYYAAMYPLQISWSTILALKNMITQGNTSSLGGPIAIAKGIKSAADMGFSIVIFYAALISTSLGFFNLLPIPTLDGGHLLFYFIESIQGRPVNEKIQEWAFTIGFIVLIALFLLVTYKDVFF